MWKECQNYNKIFSINSEKVKMKKWVVLFAEKIEKLKTLKYHIAI